MIPDNIIREVVNSLHDTALQFHDAQQLRERLRACLDPLLAAVPTKEQLQAIQQSGFDAGKAYGEMGSPPGGLAELAKPKRVIHTARLSEDERLVAAEAWAEKFGGRDADGVVIFDQVSDVADMLDAFRGDV